MDAFAEYGYYVYATSPESRISYPPVFSFLSLQSPALTVQKVAHLAASICEQNFGEAPKVELLGYVFSLLVSYGSRR